jgi:hypothetical protein
MDTFTTLVIIVFTESVTPSVILLMFRPAELKPQIYFFLLCTYCIVIHQLQDDKHSSYTLPCFNTLQFRPDVVRSYPWREHGCTSSRHPYTKHSAPCVSAPLEHHHCLPYVGFDPRTVQSVASRYTDWATGPTDVFIRTLHNSLWYLEHLTQASLAQNQSRRWKT